MFHNLVYVSEINPALVDFSHQHGSWKNECLFNNTFKCPPRAWVVVFSFSLVGKIPIFELGLGPGTFRIGWFPLICRPSKCQKLYTHRILGKNNWRQKMRKFCRNLKWDKSKYFIKYTLSVQFSILAQTRQVHNNNLLNINSLKKKK